MSIDKIDFSLSTLDHLDEQFSMYGFVNPNLPPLLPEINNNYLANIQSGLLDVTIATSFSAAALTAISMPTTSITHSNYVLLAQVMEKISPVIVTYIQWIVKFLPFGHPGQCTTIICTKWIVLLCVSILMVVLWCLLLISSCACGMLLISLVDLTPWLLLMIDKVSWGNLVISGCQLPMANLN